MKFSYVRFQMMAITLNKPVVLQMLICISTLNYDLTIAVDTQPQLIAEKANGTLQFNCSTFKEPIGLNVEILINRETKFNLRFDKQECYQKNKKCVLNDCSCSQRWFYWRQNTTSENMTVECHMRFKDDPGTDVSARSFYNGSVFFHLYTTTPTVSPTENTTNTTEIYKADSSPVTEIVIGVTVGIFLVIIILIVVCVWKCRQSSVFKCCYKAASPDIPADKPKSKPKVGKGKGNKGKCKTQNNDPSHDAQYIFTVAQEEKIALWVKSKKLLYDMTDKQFEDKELKKQLWERKAAEFGSDYDSILKWYITQKARFSKLQVVQLKKKSQKRYVDGVSHADEDHPFLAEDPNDKDSERDMFIRRIFGFLSPHTRPDRKDTPDDKLNNKLNVAQKVELAESKKSTTACSLTDKPRKSKKKYFSLSTKTATTVRPDSPTMGKRVNSVTNFCKYLEPELNSLHDACLIPAKKDISTVLFHYQDLSKRFMTREAAGDSLSEKVPSAFQSSN